MILRDMLTPRRVRMSVWAGLYGGGLIGPSLVGIALMPLIAHAFTVRELGALSLAWTFLAFVGNFDLGVGRSMGRLNALGRDDSATSSHNLAGLLIQFSMGTGIAAALGAAMLTFGPGAGLGISPLGIATIFLSVPFAAIITGLRFALEGRGQQLSSAAISFVSNSAIFVIPIALPAGARDLGVVLPIMFGSRVLIGVGVVVLYRRMVFPSQITRARIVGAAQEVMQQGKWIALLNIVAMIYAYGDKFVGSKIFSLQAMTSYIVPYEFLMRFGIIPSIVFRFLIPHFDKASLAGGEARRLLYVSYLFCIVYSIAICLFIPVLPNIIHIWIGDKLGSAANEIGQIVLINVAVSSFSFLATLIHVASGRSSTPAKVNMVLLPFFLVGVAISLALQRIELLAVTGTARICIEALILTFMLRDLVPRRHGVACFAGVCATVALAAALATWF
jgi:O-antigen/teichoic acid export membrane protein